MKKVIWVLFCLLALFVGFIFANISFTTFEEIGKPGGILVIGRSVVTGFLETDFSLWVFIISSLIAIYSLSMSIIIFYSLCFPDKEKKTTVVP